MSTRVLHYVDGDTFGGTERSLLQLVEGLAKRGFECSIRCHREPDLTRLRTEAEAKGVAIRQVPRSWGWRTPGLLWQFVRELRELRPTIVHVHMPWVLSGRDAVAAAKAARVPVVVGTVQLWIPERQGPVIHLKHRVLSRLIDRYVAVSRAVAAQLTDEYHVPERKVCVVPNATPVPAALSRRAPEGRPFTVLTVGRLHPQKGLDDLLRAAARVRDAVFLIAGDGPERARLEALARELGVADRVRFLGFRADVPDLLDACDLFVLPSLYEGLPLGVLEAMARGAPVVGTAVPGIEEALEGGAGMLVPPHDPEALAAAIASLAADPGRARGLAAKGRERVVQHFSLERMVDGVVQVYADAIEGTALRG